MVLPKLRVLAEEANKSDSYHYDFADKISPDLVLSFLNAVDTYRETIVSVCQILREDSRARLTLMHGKSVADKFLGVESEEA